MAPPSSRARTAAAAAPVSFVGEMRFSGCVIATEQPRAAIAALLPAGVGLAAPASTDTADTHPLVFIFGQQSEGAILFGGMSYPLGVRYTEFGVAIPRVTFGGHLHTYLPRMYSSYFPPVRDGNVHYGFGKAQATIEWHGPIATLASAEGALLCHATVEPSGAWRRGAPGAGELAWIEAAFALPILGRKDTGRFVRSHFRFGFRDALIRPIQCAMVIDVPLLDGMAAQRYQAAPGAAVEVQGMLWQLSWPEFDPQSP